MDYFGINHIGQLPELKELEPIENKIGEDSDQ
jgi:chromosome segregation and condensation protein ScpB